VRFRGFIRVRLEAGAAAAAAAADAGVRAPCKIEQTYIGSEKIEEITKRLEMTTVCAEESGVGSSRKNPGEADAVLAQTTYKVTTTFTQRELARF